MQEACRAGERIPAASGLKAAEVAFQVATGVGESFPKMSRHNSPFDRKAQPKRVCVLRRLQSPDERRMVDGACVSRSHSHVSFDRAEEMVHHDQASWVGDSIRVIAARVWRKRISSVDNGAMGVMQLVS